MTLDNASCKPIWKPIHTILPGDMILMPIPKFNIDTKSVKVKKAYSDNPRYKNAPATVRLDDQLLELLGTYLAEGCSSLYDNKGKFISLSGHANERPILERLETFIQNVFDVNTN